MGPDVRSRLQMLVFAAILLLQVTIPTAALLRPTPAHFGWHMFSYLSIRPEFIVTYDSGATERLNVEDLVADVPRGDIDFTDPVVDYLCRIPAIVSVIVEESGRQRETLCLP